MPGSPLERVYFRLPVPAQHLLFTAYSAKLAHARYGGTFGRTLDWLKKTEWWSAAEIQAFQEHKLRRVLAHAFRTVPYYREMMGRVGLSCDDVKTIADLAKLPVLTKRIVREQAHALVSQRYQSNRLIEHLTSGTSGTPLRVMKTREAVAMQWAIWWRHKSRFGLTPGQRHVVFGARTAVSIREERPPFWRHDYFGARLYMSGYHLSARTVRDYINKINRWRPVFITGYPSMLAELVRLARDQRLSINVPLQAVITGSDRLTPACRADFSNFFGAQVAEQYGMAEFAGNMSECEKGRLHVDFECGIIESIPTPWGGQRLLLTGWGNPAMPFIRYDVGDYGMPCNAPCPCGRQGPSFFSIDGRVEDYIYTRDSAISGINQVLEYASNAIEIQVFQSSFDALEVRIVPGIGFGRRDIENLEREFRRRLGNDIEIEYKTVDHIARRANGKFCSVISAVSHNKRGDVGPDGIGLADQR